MYYSNRPKDWHGGKSSGNRHTVPDDTRHTAAEGQSQSSIVLGVVMSSNPVLKFPLLMIVIMMIAACSSGGKSGSDPVTPSSNPTVQSLTISITSPANNATYNRGQTIQFTASAVDPVDGTLSGNALSWTSSIDGSIGLGASFSLNSLSIGKHDITLTAKDSAGVIQTATVSIEVQAASPNGAPVPTAPQIDTQAGYPGSSQISINDPDVGQNHTFAITTFPAHGTASVSASGVVTYNPTPGFTEPVTIGTPPPPNDSLAVTVTDDGSPRMSGTVTIPISVSGPVLNLPPAGTAPKLYTVEDTSSNVQISVSDPPGADQPAGTQNHTFLITTTPQNGSASVNAAGVVVYTPRTGFAGDDNLVVTVQDNGTPPMSGNVLINVTVEKAFSFVMTAHPNPARPGHRIFYSITVSNQGKTPISQVENMQDPTPLLYGKVNATEITGEGTCGPSYTACSNGLYIIWPPFGTLNAGESHTVYLAYALNGSTVDGVIPPDGTSIHNGASINYAGGTFAGASQDVQTLSTAGVMLSIDEDRDPVKPGDQLTYTLTLSNLSTDGVIPDNDWALNATIPEWADFVSADSTYTLSNGAVVWDVNQPQPGSVLQRHFTVQVKNTVNPGSVLQSETEVNDIISGQRYAHDVDTTLVKTDTPLQVTMTPAQSPNQMAVGGQAITYSITLTNTGSTQLSNITLTEVSPNDSEVSGFSGVCKDVTGTTKTICDEGELITWDPLTLDPGKSNSYSFIVTPLDTSTGQLLVPLQDGLLIHNTLRVSYSLGDFSLGNDLVVNQSGGLVVNP